MGSGRVLFKPKTNVNMARESREWARIKEHYPLDIQFILDEGLY